MDNVLSRKNKRLLGINGLLGFASIMVILNHFPVLLDDGQDIYFLRNNRSSMVYFFMIGGFMTLYASRCAMVSWRCSFLSIVKRFFLLAPMYYLALLIELCFLHSTNTTWRTVQQASFLYTWYGPVNSAQKLSYHWYPGVLFWAHVVFSIVLHGFLIRSQIKAVQWRESQCVYSGNEYELVCVDDVLSVNSLQSSPQSTSASPSNDVSQLELIDSISITTDSTFDTTNISSTEHMDSNQIDNKPDHLSLPSSPSEKNDAQNDKQSPRVNSPLITQEPMHIDGQFQTSLLPLVRQFWFRLVFLPALFYIIPSVSMFFNITYFSQTTEVTNLYFFIPQRMFEVFLGAMCCIYCHLFLQPWLHTKSSEFKDVLGYIVDLILVLLATCNYLVIPALELELFTLGRLWAKDQLVAFFTCGGIAPFVGVMLQLLSIEKGLIARTLAMQPFQLLGNCSYETFILHLVLNKALYSSISSDQGKKVCILIPQSVFSAHFIHKYVTGPLSERLVRQLPDCACEQSTRPPQTPQVQNIHSVE